MIQLFKSEAESEIDEKKLQNLKKIYESIIDKNFKIFFIEALLKINNYKDFLELY